VTACAYALVKRPTPVLSLMPQSCNRVYDVLATGSDGKGRCRLSLAELGEITQLGRQTVYLAMRRLIAAHLLDRHKSGRGRWPRLYLIRAFITGRKSDRKGGSARFRFCFPQVDAHPRHYKETQKKRKSLKASEDVSILKVTSPGHVMYHVRNVVQSNASLTDQERKAITDAFGKSVFKRGYLPRFQQHPAALQELLTLLTRPRPPGKPPRRAAVSSIYAWTFGLIQSILEKHKLGMGSILRRLQATTPGPPSSRADLTRVRRRATCAPRHRRLTYAERGKVPSWA